MLSYRYNYIIIPQRLQLYHCQGVIHGSPRDPHYNYIDPNLIREGRSAPRPVVNSVRERERERERESKHLRCRRRFTARLRIVRNVLRVYPFAYQTDSIQQCMLLTVLPAFLAASAHSAIERPSIDPMGTLGNRSYPPSAYLSAACQLQSSCLQSHCLFGLLVRLVRHCTCHLRTVRLRVLGRIRRRITSGHGNGAPIVGHGGHTRQLYQALSCETLGHAHAGFGPIFGPFRRRRGTLPSGRDAITERNVTAIARRRIKGLTPFPTCHPRE